MKNSIQRAFYSYTYQRYEILAPNIFLNWDNELDFCGIRKSGYVDEIEMKISKSDFKADFKKTSRVKSKYDCIHSPTYSYQGYWHKNKHKALVDGELSANYFSFLLPRDLIGQLDIPEYAGLYEFYERNDRLIIKELKKPKLLHKRKVSDFKKYEIAKKMAYRYWHLID